MRRIITHPGTKGCPEWQHWSDEPCGVCDALDALAAAAGVSRKEPREAKP